MRRRKKKKYILHDGDKDAVSLKKALEGNNIGVTKGLHNLQLTL